MSREELAARIINGVSIHRVTLHLIEKEKVKTKWYKPIVAAHLAWLYKIPFGDALAIVSEMDLTPGF
jgi:DNA-binding XRE family transcriptional regulator